MSQSPTDRYVALFQQGRPRLTGWLDDVTDEELPRRLHPDANPRGWMLQHIGEVELLFAKNVFGRDLDAAPQRLRTCGLSHED
ncbi:MAG: hypothetical protein BRD55_00870 [Bacteroidetes bacterium SW_9_63_38]|nr:MAG: hypothetical protein BRD55_00870 [Bacteroidetes bacterium SW_9_63_38]